MASTCTGKQLASFLGLVTFIRQHIRHFADLTAEFASLKRSSGFIEWTPQQLYNLQLLQQAIKHAPLLVFPDLSKPFFILLPMPPGLALVACYTNHLNRITKI